MTRWAAITLMLVNSSGTLTAQDTDSSTVLPGDSLTNGGVVRASALVDSVFVDRALPRAFVNGGDFASYLMARLNIRPIPDDLHFRVVIDSSRILMHGRIRDLPMIAQQELGPLLNMFSLDTRVEAFITLDQPAREVVRFHLERATVNGVMIPESVLGIVMQDVGRNYPALSRTGRDLFVEIPLDATIVLMNGGVVLTGPPHEGEHQGGGLEGRDVEGSSDSVRSHAKTY